jgi:hypothetical protein
MIIQFRDQMAEKKLLFCDMKIINVIRNYLIHSDKIQCSGGVYIKSSLDNLILVRTDPIHPAWAYNRFPKERLIPNSNKMKMCSKNGYINHKWHDAGENYTKRSSIICNLYQILLE